jgi:methoxymalonate biosynthesis acyl carrier protein
MRKNIDQGYRVTGQHDLETDTAPDEIVEELRTFFSIAVPGNVPAPEEDYFSLGLVSSLMALELVTFVEQRFGIAVEVQDLDLDNFRTMSKIAQFVRRKRSAAP